MTKFTKLVRWALRFQPELPSSVKITLFKLEQWVPVPATSDFLADHRNQQRIVETLRRYGYYKFWAVPLEEGNLPVCEVPATVAGIEEFQQYLGGFSYALFSGEQEPKWLIISVESEIHIVAGEVKIVRQFLGYTPEEAFHNFQNTLRCEPMLPQLQSYFQIA